MTDPRPLLGSPATLVAIAVAARRQGDRELARLASQALEEDFGIRLTFRRTYWPARSSEATDDEP